MNLDTQSPVDGALKRPPAPRDLPVCERSIETRRAEIARDNDAIRKSLANGSMTSVPFSVHLAEHFVNSDLSFEVFLAVKHFNQFTPDVDPRGLHEWGRIEMEGEVFYFRIEYLSADGREQVNPFREEPHRRLCIMHLSDT